MAVVATYTVVVGIAEEADLSRGAFTFARHSLYAPTVGNSIVCETIV